MSFTGPTRIPTQFFRERKVRLATPTEAEAALRDAFLAADIRVAREEPMVGGFFADFFLRTPRICVEVDGSSHDSSERKTKDQQRDAILAERNIVTLRFTNAEVLKDPAAVVAKVAATAAERGDQRYPHLRRLPR